MRTLDYNIKTSITLANEYYTNKGLKQEEMMKAIDKINGVWMVTKHCINSNIEVHLRTNDPRTIDVIASDIKWRLEAMLSH
tara:strand:- start:1260 stop:1502 length:243 start_codon:yes stop_codon:yes gene_type:complete